MSRETVPAQRWETGAYLERNPIISIRARHVAALLRDLHGGAVLDLGCADGSISQPLPAARLTLVDLSPAMLERARQNVPWAECIQANVLEWKSDRLYDAVLAIGLFAHVSSPDLLLQKVVEALRPGGRCIVQITDGGTPLGWLHTRYARLRRYKLNEFTSRELIVRASRYSLRPIAVRRYGFLFPGSGRLPYHWQLRIEGWFASGWLSQIGAESLILFRRETAGA